MYQYPVVYCAFGLQRMFSNAFFDRLSLKQQFKAAEYQTENQCGDGVESTRSGYPKRHVNPSLKVFSEADFSRWRMLAPRCNSRSSYGAKHGSSLGSMDEPCGFNCGIWGQFRNIDGTKLCSGEPSGYILRTEVDWNISNMSWMIG